MREIIEEALTKPKVTSVVVAATATQDWWLDWGVPIIEGATKVGSFILIIIMIFLQYNKLIQTRAENKERKQAKKDKAKAAHTKTPES